MSSSAGAAPPRNTILAGDVLERLEQLPCASVDCVVTSPPYFALRDYCGEPGQLGMEPTVEDYVDSLLWVSEEIARVLKPTGSFWLNLRDVYSKTSASGAPRKSLLLAPERLLLALADDGWWVRNRIVWAKPNPVPEAVRDRMALTHEDLFLLTRQKDYFFDLDVIRLAHSTQSAPSRIDTPHPDSPYLNGHRGIRAMHAAGRVGHDNGKNPGTIWHYAASSYRGAHFATFPEGLVERPILASCPERLCTSCGEPWSSDYERQGPDLLRIGYQPACQCEAPFVPGLVLDPFFGSGTVGVVATRLQRDWLGIELSAAYRKLARRRLQAARTMVDSLPQPRRQASAATPATGGR